MSFGNNPNFDQSREILPSQNAKIEVIGVGGGGSNADNRMINSDLEGVSFRVLNTEDLDTQLQLLVNMKMQLKELGIITEIEMIDLTDPINPKIKVFKP